MEGNARLFVGVESVASTTIRTRGAGEIHTTGGRGWIHGGDVMYQDAAVGGCTARYQELTTVPGSHVEPCFSIEGTAALMVVAQVITGRGLPVVAQVIICTPPLLLTGDPCREP